MTGIIDMQFDGNPPPVRRLLRTAEDDNLWRIFPLERALQLFGNRKNVLVAPRKWDDPFENFIARCSVPVGRGVHASLGGLTRSFYGQCWCHSGQETDAMWRIYVPKTERGIRIRVRAGALFDTIYRPQDQTSSITCFLGRILYRSEKDLACWLSSLKVDEELLRPDALGIAEALLIKRCQFAHENETRLLFRCPDNAYSGSDIIEFDCDPDTLVQHVLLDPRWSVVEAQLVEKQLRCLGYRGPIDHSTLYSIPQVTNLQPLTY